MVATQPLVRKADHYVRLIWQEPTGRTIVLDSFEGDDRQAAVGALIEFEGVLNSEAVYDPATELWHAEDGCTGWVSTSLRPASKKRVPQALAQVWKVDKSEGTPRLIKHVEGDVDYARSAFEHFEEVAADEAEFAHSEFGKEVFENLHEYIILRYAQ